MVDDASLDKLFASPASAPEWRCWLTVRELEKDSELMDVKTLGSFPILSYLKSMKISVKRREGQHVSVSLKKRWNAVASLSDDDQSETTERILNPGATITYEVCEELQNGTIEFAHEDCTFRLYVFTYLGTRDSEQRTVILAFRAADRAKGKTLIAKVYEWANALRKEIWVYNDLLGGWAKDTKFFADVQSANADDLILPANILSDLERDTTTFFACRSLYKDLGIPWKRGILLLGPPGNGKTGTIKVLAKKCAQRNVPILYVQAAAGSGGKEFGMLSIFQKAREEAPCVLVLEDIETFAVGSARTFLLNQLDGIESNDGVLVIATANDVTHLDPALLQRPSRFDTKYKFDVPNVDLRKRFIKHWLEVKIGTSHLSFGAKEDVSGLVDDLATRTQGWTFAFLKELFISTLLARAAKMNVNDTTTSVKISLNDIVEQATSLDETKDTSTKVKVSRDDIYDNVNAVQGQIFLTASQSPMSYIC